VEAVSSGSLWKNEVVAKLDFKETEFQKGAKSGEKEIRVDDRGRKKTHGTELYRRAV